MNGTLQICSVAPTRFYGQRSTGHRKTCGAIEVTARKIIAPIVTFDLPGQSQEIYGMEFTQCSIELDVRVWSVYAGNYVKAVVFRLKLPRILLIDRADIREILRSHWTYCVAQLHSAIINKSHSAAIRQFCEYIVFKINKNNQKILQHVSW